LEGHVKIETFEEAQTQDKDYTNDVQLEKLYQHADKGLVVFDVTPFIESHNLLTVDLDAGMPLKIEELTRFGGPSEAPFLTISKSGEGRHAYVIMDRPIKNHGLLAVLAGGDPRREYLSAENVEVRVKHQYCMYETQEQAARVRSFLKKHGIVPVEVTRPKDVDTCFDGPTSNVTGEPF
jgi:hypothetical protein